MKCNSSTDKRDIFVRVGKSVLKFFVDVRDEVLDNHGEKAFSEAISIGIKNTIIALHNVGASDEDIQKELIDVWGIDKNDTIFYIERAKGDYITEILQEYLKKQGWDEEDIEHFIKSPANIVCIRKDKKAWELIKDSDLLYNYIASSGKKM